jgi:hypothetical protein
MDKMNKGDKEDFWRIRRGWNKFVMASLLMVDDDDDDDDEEEEELLNG